MNWLNAPGSAEARALAEVGWVLIAGASTVFVLTMALLALSLRARRRAAPTAWRVVGGGIVFPAVVLSVLLAYAVLRTAGLERPPAGNPLVVGVTRHLWWWEVRYHDPASGRWIGLANELRLPAGRPVQLGLTSADVIHSFWVLTLGGKIDLVPGRTNRLVVTALDEGVHRGVCAEYCGTQHAKMALHVVVLPAAAFEQWGTMVLVLVDLTVFGSMAFAHMHVSMLVDTCPPAGSALPELAPLLGACTAFAASGALVGWCGRPLRLRALHAGRALALLLPAAALAVAGVALLVGAHEAAGLVPRANAWSATVAALLSYAGLHAVLIVLFAGYLIARAGAGLLTLRQRATWDNCALLWWCGCAQGIVVALLPHLVAEWMG